MSKKKKMEWVAFYSPDGRLLMTYTKQGTFPGEKENTIELLAAEYGYKQEQISVKIVTEDEI